MSQGFSFKYDQMRQSDPTHQDQPTSKPDKVGEFYPSHSHVRNVCFVMLDGRMKFLNYAYLVSGECLPDGSHIALAFTSDVVSLNGLRLKPLFFQFMQHLPQIVTCMEARYNTLADKDKPIVNAIEIISTNV